LPQKLVILLALRKESEPAMFASTHRIFQGSLIRSAAMAFKSHSHTKSSNLQYIATRSFAFNVIKNDAPVIEGRIVAPKNRDLINANYGLSQFINKTYLFTGGGIVSSLAVSSGIAHTILPSSPGVMMFGGFLLSLGGILGVGATRFNIKKDVIVDPKNERTAVEVYSSENSPARIASYGAFLTGMAMCTSPLFIAYPNAILPAFAASSAVFGSAALYAYSKPVGSLSLWGPTLSAGLGGLLGVTVLGWLSDMFFGANAFGSTAQMINLYAGIPLFTGFIAYDTHRAIEMYQARIPDHLGCSTQLYLDFMNIFVRLVQNQNQ
jgi:FtsH-binding integral membrane protein